MALFTHLWILLYVLGNNSELLLGLSQECIFLWSAAFVYLPLGPLPNKCTLNIKQSKQLMFGCTLNIVYFAESAANCGIGHAFIYSP